MLTRTQLAELPPRPGASPGLLRRRYSVPETIMRKYRLAQQRSDSDESAHTTSPSPASASPPRGSCSSLCDTPHRFMRRDRELMRKSALLRRMWGRSCNPCQTCCYCSGDLADSQTCCGRETRSLDGSRSELRHLSSSFTSSRQSHATTAAAGWTSPKRLRLDSPRDFRGSDEMLRAAMRNSYDRAEEARFDTLPKTDLADSTGRSYCHDVSSHTGTTETFINSCAFKFEDPIEQNVSTQGTDTFLSDAATAEIDLNVHTEIRLENENQSDTSESLSISMSTTKETNGFIAEKFCKQISSSSAHIEGRISERSLNLENNDNNILSYDTPLTVETPAYELLEIMVSETSNSNSVPVVKHGLPEIVPTRELKVPLPNVKNTQNINIDEYVSNILVESLNSLTDQIECMNASISNDRKVSIVEKEIKVKLQNTGVNTIVHLSPMSNNQIIFGNEELYNNDENKNNCNNPQDVRGISFRDEVHSVESNNNLTSGESLRDQNPSSLVHHDLYSDPAYNNVHQHDNVNKAVLQQIQKLFQDEFSILDSEHYSKNAMPEISHIEISNVDVYIDNNADPALGTTDTVDIQVQRDTGDSELISSVGAGNYFQDSNDNIIVPRFSALPHTDSMEVNTSSSEDVDNVGSDCTSLVDSLDDPNSPRSILLRRSFNPNKRNDLARSAIDVLDLLPENSYTNQDDINQAKEKGESFFIRIKDNDFDCERKNIVVADHMPEKIKERLYRRHRKREMRLECARRSKVKQLKKDLEKQRHSDTNRSKKELEKDCMAIMNALIDEVIAKVAQDEHKCMRIKQKSNKVTTSKSDENISKRNWKKDLEFYSGKTSGKFIRNSISKSSKTAEKQQVHGKLSLLTHPSIVSDERGPRRFYQKSEIQDGNKCIEILEILEYVNGSQSSPDITNSDDSQGSGSKNKKSRIPIPVYERPQKIHINNKNLNSRRTSSTIPRDRNTKSNQLITNMLLEVLADNENESDVSEVHNNERLQSMTSPARRASVPHYEPRLRSNSVKFKRIFDIIPEERSSLSIDSSNEDIHYNRRASAPNLADEILPSYNKNKERVNADTSRTIETIKSRDSQEFSRISRETKCTGTSPLVNNEEVNNLKKKSQTTMTSPSQRSAATSPIRISTTLESTSTTTSTSSTASAGPASRGRAWPRFQRREAALHGEGLKEKSVEMDKSGDRRSITTRYDRELDSQRTVRTVQTETVDPVIVDGDKNRDKSKLREKDVDTDTTEAESKKRTGRTKSVSRDRNNRTENDNVNRATNGNVTFRKTDKRKIRTISMERSEEETVRTKSVKLPEFRRGGSASSSDSGESGGSLLCSLAPAWLAARHRRAPRRRGPPPPADLDAAGGWSVTVAGSCRSALPADVEMRLRFPPERDPPPHPPPPLRAHNSTATSCTPTNHQEWRCRARQRTECTCTCCGACGGGAHHERSERADRRAPPLPPAAAPAHLTQPPHLTHDAGRLTVTMKKEALGSSVLATKSEKKSHDPLPDLETYRESRSKMKSSVKTRRGYSLHCWLPDDAPTLLKTNNGLSVLGSAIIPELKPRVPTMSERDLTRVYTPRHYLRS
ncbi:uncharacterized protein ACR2FA_007092 [Aphomia sociella]